MFQQCEHCGLGFRDGDRDSSVVTVSAKRGGADLDDELEMAGEAGIRWLKVKAQNLMRVVKRLKDKIASIFQICRL